MIIGFASLSIVSVIIFVLIRRRRSLLSRSKSSPLPSGTVNTILYFIEEKITCWYISQDENFLDRIEPSPCHPYAPDVNDRSSRHAYIDLFFYFRF